MDDILTTPQAAALLGIKPQTLRKWRMRGKGPMPMKEGAHQHYFKHHVEAYAINHPVLTRKRKGA